MTSGTLSAGSNNLSLTANWTNNDGTGAFNAGTGIVSFNGTSAQSLGGSFATTFNTLNINNTAGVTLNVATTIPSAATVQLQNGAFTLSSALTVASGGNVVRDNGTFSATPTGGYSGVNLTYADLGTNASPTVGTEWPASFTGNVNVNKAGTVTLNATKTVLTGNMTLTSGTFNMNNFSLPLTGNWTNNGATLVPGSGTVTLQGSGSQIAGGTATNTFSNLTLAAAAGLGSNAAISGVLNLGSNILSTGSNQVNINTGGSVSNTTGYVRGYLYYSINGLSSVTYQIGDADYAPVTIAIAGGSPGSYSGSIGATVTAGDHPALGSSGITLITLITIGHSLQILPEADLLQ